MLRAIIALRRCRFTRGAPSAILLSRYDVGALSVTPILMLPLLFDNILLYYYAIRHDACAITLIDALRHAMPLRSFLRRLRLPTRHAYWFAPFRALMLCMPFRLRLLGIDTLLPPFFRQAFDADGLMPIFASPLYRIFSLVSLYIFSPLITPWRRFCQLMIIHVNILRLRRHDYLPGFSRC